MPYETAVAAPLGATAFPAGGMGAGGVPERSSPVPVTSGAFRGGSIFGISGSAFTSGAGAGTGALSGKNEVPDVDLVGFFDHHR